MKNIPNNKVSKVTFGGLHHFLVETHFLYVFGFSKNNRTQVSDGVNQHWAMMLATFMTKMVVKKIGIPIDLRSVI